LIISLIPFFAAAQLQPAAIFAHNMLLQRQQPIHIWGKGLPGKQVSVSFLQTKKTVTAKADSSWAVYFPKQEANAVPQSMIIVSGKEKIQFNNILIGDIWLCIGQSNMEWPMSSEMHFAEETANSNHPLLRFYNPAYAGKGYYSTTFTDSIVQLLHPGTFYKGQWQSSDSNTFRTMSTVTYYFGKRLTAAVNISIGLINLSMGGAPLETFIDINALKKSQQFSAKQNKDWLQNDALPVWVRERGQQNVGTASAVPADANGKNHPFKPGFAYAAGIAPLLPLPIKGILNYQGESNAQETERVKEYAALTKLMVDDYRKKWKQPTLPFYYVQLSSIDTIKYKGQLWPQFRNEQRKMSALIQNSGMAVSSDIGARNDVHPRNKKDVGERLARWALNKTYGKNIIPSGPLPVKAKYEAGKLVISFQYTARGLKTADGKLLNGFSLDGINKTEAIIGDSGIIIYANTKPEFIYYGWKPFSDGNLVNSEGLPASTFKVKVQ